MPEVDELILEFLESNSGDWYDAESVMRGIDDDFSEGYIRDRLDGLTESHENIEDRYWAEEVFGYFFGDRFVPGSREALVRVLRPRIDQDVDSMSLTELRSIAEQIANPAPVDVTHRDFRYQG